MASLVTFDGTAVKVNNQIEGDVHLVHFDRRVAAIRDNVIGEGAQVTIIQQAPESRSVRKARERAEREQAVLDRAYELLLMIRDPDMPVDGKNFRAKEEELGALVYRIQKDTPKEYYTTSNEGILEGSALTPIEFVKRLDKEFFTQSERSYIYYEDAGYETELAQVKFNAGAVPRLLYFALHLYLDKHDLMPGRYYKPKHCMIL